MQKPTSLFALFAAAFIVACEPTAPPGSTPGTPSTPSTLTIDDSPGTAVWSVAGAGTYNSCATDAAGAPYCWGFDLVDMCGNTSCTVLSVPTRFPSAAAPLESVAVGSTMACGVGADDNV